MAVPPSTEVPSATALAVTDFWAAAASAAVAQPSGSVAVTHVAAATPSTHNSVTAHAVAGNNNNSVDGETAHAVSKPSQKASAKKAKPPGTGQNSRLGGSTGSSKKPKKKAVPLGSSERQLNVTAASIIMSTMYAARMAKPELSRCVQMMATQLTRWTELEDKKLHRSIEAVMHLLASLLIRRRSCVSRSSRIRILPATVQTIRARRVSLWPWLVLSHSSL